MYEINKDRPNNSTSANINKPKKNKVKYNFLVKIKLTKKVCFIIFYYFIQIDFLKFYQHNVNNYSFQTCY